MTVRSSTQMAYLERAYKAYAEQLWNENPTQSQDSVRSYFNSHAITQAIAKKYGLGFVDRPLPGDHKFSGGISIPYLPPAGLLGSRIADIKFRLFGGDRKLDKHKGYPARLFNTQAYFDAIDSIGLAEGEIDAITATEYLGLPTLGVPGVSAWKDCWTHLFKDYQTVYVFGDGDQAGRDFANDLAERLTWRAQIVSLPPGEDISSLAAKDELDILRQRITTSNQEA